MADGGVRLWLWRNGDEFVAYSHEIPCDENGDPLTLGEPAATAIFKPSRHHVKPTIAELEAILAEPDKKVEILPDGSVIVQETI